MSCSYLYDQHDIDDEIDFGEDLVPSHPNLHWAGCVDEGWR
ncbi:hypothetical protein COLO4_21552 [Corchorus olitorius]|uniref:Uncharacterized protein n=1 Tax=Corchorus olitorius TaxID=93759 RepID=A0A1R3ISP5_9ROSI|nr:hypothetical protein COLO4_21552 [Corchorus olitorius]